MAGGKGERLGGAEEKALAQVLGHSLLAWCLAAFEPFSEIVETVIVVPPGRESVFERRLAEYSRSVFSIVPGGEQRQDSVNAGLKALSEAPHWVLVHDAARPLVSKDLLTRIFEALDAGESVVPALKVTDSIARVGYDTWLKEYEDRTQLISVQTPQAFHRSVLEFAYKDAFDHDHYGTDEASLVLRVNHPVSWIPGDPENIKITWPADLPVAEAILRARGYEST